MRGIHEYAVYHLPSILGKGVVPEPTIVNDSYTSLITVVYPIYTPCKSD